MRLSAVLCRHASLASVIALAACTSPAEPTASLNGDWTPISSDKCFGRSEWFTITDNQIVYSVGGKQTALGNRVRHRLRPDGSALLFFGAKPGEPTDVANILVLKKLATGRYAPAFQSPDGGKTFFPVERTVGLGTIKRIFDMRRCHSLLGFRY